MRRFTKNLSHPSTYHTQHKFNAQRKESRPKKNKTKPNYTPLLFSGIHLNQMSLSQKLVFLLALSAIIYTATTTETVTEKTQPSPNSASGFFSPSPSNNLPVPYSQGRIQPIDSYSLVAHRDMSHKLTVYDMSSQLQNCQSKSRGVSAGKVCFINGKEHWLKVCKGKIKDQNRYSNIMLGIYNLAFIEENIGVQTPNVTLIHERNGTYRCSANKLHTGEYYLASEFVEDFLSFESILDTCSRHALKSMSKDNPISKEELVHSTIIQKIGERGLAQVAVVGTFIQDVVGNPGNWGVAKNKLVIIDADHSPESVEDHLIEAVKMPRNINMHFSIKTIKHMESIYKSMRRKSPVHIHPTVNFPIEEYHDLIGQYITACRNAIKILNNIYPALSLNTPSPLINEALSDALKHQLIQYQEKIRDDEDPTVSLSV